MKKILILNGSFCEVPIIKRAKEMGYYVVTTGNAPELEGHKYSDEYIACDYSDKDAILDLVKENNIEGIVSCANDFGVLTASYVCEKMGWKGHDSYENAVMIHHKDRFKEYCNNHNIPSPHSMVFLNIGDAKEYCAKCEYPIIVKANDLTGGKGIKKAENYAQAEEALTNAFEWSRDKHILVEPFIQGTQHSICVFLVDKKIIASSSCQSYSFKNPYLIQSETFPSRYIQGKIKKDLEEIIENMAQDLNLSDGILNLQLIIKDDKPYIIECMRRSFGNDALMPYTKVTGFDWVEAYIRVSLGEKISCKDKYVAEDRYCGHFGVFADKNGELKSCFIDDEIEKHIFKKINMILPSQKIENYMNERIMYLYFSYDDIEEMNKDICTYNDRIRVEIV